LFGDDHRAVRDHLMTGADHTQVFTVDWALGAVLLVRRDALKRLFLFDPRYFLYFEDVDLCRHIAESGQKTLFCGDAVAVHAHHRASAGRLLSRASRWHATSMVKYFLKRHRVSVTRRDVKDKL
jgi:N-acetylglucosaminyl-diphospho-decaprenol L-rhamnosyltransferase